MKPEAVNINKRQERQLNVGILRLANKEPGTLGSQT